MYIFTKKHYCKILLLSFIILIGCQIQEPVKNHGILFLENRSKVLIVNKTNKNDVIKIIGQPHTRSLDDDQIWIYVERVLTKGKYHKLGQHVLKENNTLVLDFNKFGVLSSKKFYTKDDLKKIKFTEKSTENKLSKQSFVESFLQSVKQKMYSQRK
tara:strand:+ start:189 stop:656 length:468 start_codon:yes stop_codon:yes gene_type:complete